MLNDISDHDFQAKVLESPVPVLVDFWAPWCVPCKMATPVLEELANVYQHKVAIVKLNVDENPAFAGNYGVVSIPTTILFQGGKEIDRQIGFAGKAAFEELIKKIVT